MIHRQLLYFFILLLITITKSNASLLYNTNDNSKTIFDCFYAHIIGNRNPDEMVLFQTNNLIPYCRRPLPTDPINKVQGHIENTYTFKNLRLQGITSEDLLQWSTSIDIIEQYSIYLIKNNTGLDEFIFNNCSSLWFGSNCEYTFNLSMSIESFGDYVVSSFKARENYTNKILIHTCYSHLSGCYRGPEPMCLDWREVCDGKIDCIGDSFGIDEEYCNELEITECKENEYRCHNGAQCIPLEFFRDGRPSKDCLDGTDEADVFKQNEFWNNEPFQPSTCIDSMLFACEERTCRQPHAFSCGDGSCLLVTPGFNLAGDQLLKCASTRRNVYYSEVIHKSAKQYLNDCYLLLFCKLGFYDILKNDTYNITDCSRENLLSKNCTLEYIPFPLEPIFNGYFQPLYSKQLLNKSKNGDGWPSYMCNNPRLCLYLKNATTRINGSDCRSSSTFSSDNPDLSIKFRNDAEICALMGNINEYKSKSSLFYCEKSRKYISKHRLIDGIQDCYHDEDESYNASCSLNDTQRFNCTSETKCLSPIGIGFDYPQCKNEEDKYKDKLKISVYAQLCNRIYHYAELPPEDDGEDDETNCEWWPCHTPYTRCDNVFHCANGIDELNCPNVNCNINEFKCQIIDSTNDYYCIPQQYIYEKPIDCIGHNISNHLDRTTFYSNNLTFNINKEYISWKEKTCLTKNDMCGSSSTNDQQLICNIIEKENIRFNADSLINLYNNGTLCRMADHRLHDLGFYYFSTWNLGYFPPIENETLSSTQQSINSKPKKPLEIRTSIELIEYCNRGIVIFEGKSFEKKCLCPPNYYGDRCQWQNQRISLTLQIHPLGSYEKKLSIYEIFVYLIDDENGIIHSYEKINYIPSIDCDTKYNRYLLYPDQPKNPNYTYSIHIDIYEKLTLDYYGSWYLFIPFPFLPVNRISTQLRIPLEKSEELTNCSIQCGNHGKCFNYINSTKEFCYCDQGYSGRFCNITYQHSCSSGSTALNTSICLCQLNKFGSKCYLQHTYCQPKNNPCNNHGLCITIDDRIKKNDYICLCTEGYMGSQCEYQSHPIDIHFKIDLVPLFIIAHYVISFTDKSHERITMFKKIPFDQYSIELSYTTPFNLLFIEFEKNYYLTVIREKPIQSEKIFTNINQDYKCENISKFLNSTILNYNALRRLKYYQLPCIENLKLKCFYDDKYMCVCDNNRYSNCFEFDLNMSYDCQGNNYCGKNGECFQNNITCPSMLVCKCDKCHYGSKCELTTKGFSTSLDVIFGYHIKPFISFTKQSTAVKITASITILMLIFSIINGILSILTFKNESLLKVGCGIYLLTNSIISILTITIFTIKYFQLIIFQMKSITNTSFINFSCILTDVLLKILLSFGDWLYAAVAIERTSNAVQGIHFNKTKSIYIAKYVIPIILLSISISYIHDPISRRLFNDDDEQRTWCILEYSTNLKTYDKFINIFHVLIPFIINIFSAICITIQVFRIRIKTKKKSTYKKLLCIQIQQHKHLLISPCILILLSIPRLIISFLSGCMESVRNPWLYLTGYYISFIPPLLIIILFILPSRTYKEEFISIIKKINFISK